MLLKEMTAAQAVAHYEALNARRIARAQRDWTLAQRGSAALRSAAQDGIDKAVRMARPRQHWHIAAALERRTTHGVLIAACFLRANGWDISEAKRTLCTSPPTGRGHPTHRPDGATIERYTF